MRATLNIRTPEEAVAFIEFALKYDLDYAFDKTMPPEAQSKRPGTSPKPKRGKFSCPDLILLALFETAGSLHRTKLGLALERGGYSAKTLPNTLAGLINGGRVETDGDGNYSLTTEGSKVAKQLSHLKETGK